MYRSKLAIQAEDQRASEDIQHDARRSESLFPGRREPVELFRGVNVDWLGKKWYFLAFSLIFSVAGVISMASHWALPAASCLWASTSAAAPRSRCSSEHPDIAAIHRAVDTAGIKMSRFKLWRHIISNEVLIGLPEEQNEPPSKPAASSRRCPQENYTHNPFDSRHQGRCRRPDGRQAAEKQASWRPSTRCSACWSISGSVPADLWRGGRRSRLP